MIISSPENIEDSTRINITEARIRAIGATRYEVTPAGMATARLLADSKGQDLEADRSAKEQR